MRFLCGGLIFTFLSGSALSGAQQAPALPSPLQDQKGAAQPGSEKPGGIRGRVTAADTATGLRRARVMLRALESRQAGIPQTAQTNENGEYEIRELKPGQYSLTAMRNGYVPQAYGQKSTDSLGMMTPGTLLTIRPGEVLSQVNFQLVRGGVVEGQVVDQYNEPLSRVMVQLSRYRTLQGKRSLIPAGGGTSTDDRGYFRLFDVTPGNYYLSATNRGFGFPDGGGAFPPTYYPGVLTPQEASKIQVTAAGEVSGISLVMTEAASFTISGKVYGSDGKPASGAMIMSARHPSEGAFDMMRGGSGTDADGNFRLESLLPGKYRLTARTGRGDGKGQSGSAVVDVGSEDVKGVSIVVGSGAEVAGKIVVEGQAAQPLEPRQVHIWLMPEAGSGVFFGTGPQQTNDDFTFRLTDVSEGPSRFNVSLPGGGFYLKSIRLEGRDVTDQVVEFRNNERFQGVEVIISAQGAQLNGTVRKEENNELVKGATVVLFAADPQRLGKTRFIKITQTDQQGSFVLKGVVPAEYVVCALINHEAGAETDAAFLQAVEKLGKRVELRAGASKTEDLTAAIAPKWE